MEAVQSWPTTGLKSRSKFESCAPRRKDLKGKRKGKGKSYKQAKLLRIPIVDSNIEQQLVFPKGSSSNSSNNSNNSSSSNSSNSSSSSRSSSDGGSGSSADNTYSENDDVYVFSSSIASAARSHPSEP